MAWREAASSRLAVPTSSERKIGRKTWNLHWSINEWMTVETEAELMDKGTERLEVEGGIIRGMGFGNVRSNSDWESRNSREPK